MHYYLFEFVAGVFIPYTKSLSSSLSQPFFQLCNCLFRISFVFIQQGDEAAAYDGAGGVGASGVESLFVADAEADHAGIAQMHILYFLEVGLLLGIKILLGTGSGGTGYHIDEAIGVLVDFADTGFAGLGGDEHDEADVVAVGDGFISFFVILEREVGDDDTIDAAFHAFPAEGFEAELHDGVKIAHEDKGDVYVIADIAQLLEKQAQGHTVAESLGSGILNDNAVSHRVAEGNADFNHVDVVAFEGTDDVSGAFQSGTTGTEVDGQQVLGTVLEKLIYTIHVDDL